MYTTKNFDNGKKNEKKKKITNVYRDLTLLSEPQQSKQSKSPNKQRKKGDKLLEDPFLQMANNFFRL